MIYLDNITINDKVVKLFNDETCLVFKTTYTVSGMRKNEIHWKESLSALGEVLLETCADDDRFLSNGGLKRSIDGVIGDFSTDLKHLDDNAEFVFSKSSDIAG